MPPEQEASTPRTVESASASVPVLTPEQFTKLVDKVLEMLLLDLKAERERIGASFGFPRRKGVR